MLHQSTLCDHESLLHLSAWRGSSLQAHAPKTLSVRRFDTRSKLLSKARSLPAEVLSLRSSQAREKVQTHMPENVSLKRNNLNRKWPQVRVLAMSSSLVAHVLSLNEAILQNGLADGTQYDWRISKDREASLGSSRWSQTMVSTLAPEIYVVWPFTTEQLTSIRNRDRC